VSDLSSAAERLGAERGDAESVEDRFNANPDDPLFRLVDGANCPSADVSSLEAKKKAYSPLLSKGVIRIGLPMQSAMQFEIGSVQDPYNCTLNPGPSGDRTHRPKERYCVFLSPTITLR